MAREKFEAWRRTNQDRIHVNKGIEYTVTLTLSEQKYETFPINKNDVKDLNIEISAVDFLEAPIFENDAIR